MGGTGAPDDGCRGREESQEERIERERVEAGDEERDSAAGPGYTARPTDREPEDEPPDRGDPGG